MVWSVDELRRIGKYTHPPSLIPCIFECLLTSISGFLHMETIGNKEEIRMNKFNGLGHKLFRPVAGREHKLNPALVSTVSNVVLNGSTDHAFSKHPTHDELVK
jgi:hypothetical protein